MPTQEQTHKIYVLYHAHCTDGTGSKYAAWKRLHHRATYIAVNYNQPMPELEPGSEIYIVDFSYPKTVLEALQATHKSVVVLDHHKTAEEALRGVKGCVFDMHKSGCVMTWEYFHPNTSVPNLLLDIQDRDLWLWKRPNSKAVHAGLNILEGDMHEWDKAATIPNHYDKLVSIGNTFLRKQDLVVKSAVKSKTKVINFLGYKCGITNQCDLSSEIGNGICLSKELDVDFAVVYCITASDDVLLSFRSLGDFDVSELAKKFGGGGHKNASGANVKLDVLIKILAGEL
jgi:oligoribonuclease NrnB/cAMP/cGMP phosphodiesterase (DHH superfamily)